MSIGQKCSLTSSTRFLAMDGRLIPSTPSCSLTLHLLQQIQHDVYTMFSRLTASFFLIGTNHYILGRVALIQKWCKLTRNLATQQSSFVNKNLKVLDNTDMPVVSSLLVLYQTKRLETSTSKTRTQKSKNLTPSSLIQCAYLAPNRENGENPILYHGETFLIS